MQSPPVIVYPAGTYSITTTGPTTITYTATSVTLSWAVAPGPVPPTPVPPAPAPTPVLSGHVWALAIYDPAVALPTAQQAALTSPTLKAAALLQDVDIQPFKSNDPSVASWLPHLPKSGLPALLFVQRTAAGTGELAHAVALPASEADILSLVNKVRGK